jgi:hypothetical protein
VATQYVLLTSQAVARAESEEFWNKVLGRLKLPQDITQFLFGILVDPVDGRALAVVTDASYSTLVPHLSNQEKQALDNKLRPAGDPQVILILGHIAAANPVGN